MSKETTSLTDSKQSCENIISFISNESLISFIKMAVKLNISMLSIDNFSIVERDNFISNTNLDVKCTLLSPLQIYNLKNNHVEEDVLFINSLKKILKSNKTLLISRKTIYANSLKELKNKLGNARSSYEIISIKSNDKNSLKWAAHDRRVDYLTFNIADDVILDSALCSLIKQHDKIVEIVLQPLYSSKNEKELSNSIRKGKKLLKYIIANKLPFVLTINPKNPFQLRTGIQLRYLGEVIGIPFNKSSKAVFDNQLLILFNNIPKFNEAFVVDGLMEV